MSKTFLMGVAEIKSTTNINKINMMLTYLERRAGMLTGEDIHTRILKYEANLIKMLKDRIVEITLLGEEDEQVRTTRSMRDGN